MSRFFSKISHQLKNLIWSWLWIWSGWNIVSIVGWSWNCWFSCYVTVGQILHFSLNPLIISCSLFHIYVFFPMSFVRGRPCGRLVYTLLIFKTYTWVGFALAGLIYWFPVSHYNFEQLVKSFRQLWWQLNCNILSCYCYYYCIFLQWNLFFVRDYCWET